MLLQNKNRLAYLGALTLLFSYAEMLLPRIAPFFRLGLGNITILLALNLDPLSFFVLCAIKSVAASMMGGTLLSPFFLVSICQSIISGFCMYGFFRIKGKWLGLYGISLIGSAVSSVVQLLLCSLYLGKQTFSLLGPMLLFSIFAAVITAFFALNLQIPLQAPQLIRTQQPARNKKNIFIIIAIILCAIITFMMKNLWFLTAALVLAFIFQLISGRKIYLLPHITLWIFVILISLFTPAGKILFKIGKFKITRGALFSGIDKALKLSIASALSQCAAGIKTSWDGLIGLSLSYFGGLSDNLRSQKGNFIKRLQSTLSAQTLTEKPAAEKNSFFAASILLLIIFIILFAADFFIQSIQLY